MRQKQAAGDVQGRYRYQDIATPLGTLRLVSKEDALCEASFLARDDEPAPAHWQCETAPVLRQAEEELAQWFAGQRQRFDVPMRPIGTDFQRQVWRALIELEFGELVSYGDLARRIGRPKAVRPMGGAVGRNPLVIFIPCHRVIGHDTSLTGFSSGLARKRELLAHEGHRYVGPDARTRRTSNAQAELPW
ncbi:methylated-DNA--protein-cysteine methyltransferase [Bordetella ansorpii]|uniref:Methylated-DNA--protein-cysteine methyltransferase n=1 Tax=Bordetella ansorpii TaxID=288768 RepID=A0A157SIW3_9BORD|nr:methylated-DNA--[protein]-cysteine S-methyltransferase [Bordetella ansorpii]SAI70347.1 methylated-DNA--protein-cysteine methyltransferase [Bordetella ansorpii]